MKLLLLIALSLPAHAWSPEENGRRTAALKEIAQLTEKAETELPPCEGIRFLKDELARFAPSADCAEASLVFARLAAYQSRAIPNCQQMTSYVSSQLRGPAQCEGDAPSAPAFARLKNFKLSLGEPYDAEAEIGNFARSEQIGAQGGPGEFSRFECAQALELGTQALRRQPIIVKKIYAISEASFNDSCELNRGLARDRYLRFLEHGEY